MSCSVVASAFSISARVITLVITGVLSSVFGVRVPVTTTRLRSLALSSESVCAARASGAIADMRSVDKRVFIISFPVG